MKTLLAAAAAIFALVCLTPSSAGAQTSSPQPAPSVRTLAGTSWRLVQFQGSDGAKLIPAASSRYTIAFVSATHVSVRFDCNRGAGTWSSAGPNQLTFGPLALTRAACTPNPLNGRIARDWSFVRSYVVHDGHLFLALFADGGTYEYAPL